MTCADRVRIRTHRPAPRAIFATRVDNRPMTPFGWMAIALGTALVAMIVAGLGRGGSGVGQFLADLRAWVRREPVPAGSGAPTDAGEPEVTTDAEEGGVDDIFTIGDQPTHAYVEPAEMARPLARVTQRAVGGLTGRNQR